MLLLPVLPRLSDDCRNVPVAKHTDADRRAQGGAGGEHTDGKFRKRWRDYLALHITVGARQEVPSEALQYLINQDGRTSRYGQPVYVMQVREEDMGGEFRVGLLNHATFDEIQDGSQKFVECTWVKGYTPDSIRVLLTGWYEVRNTGLCPVDSLEWTEDTEF